MKSIMSFSGVTCGLNFALLVSVVAVVVESVFFKIDAYVGFVLSLCISFLDWVNDVFCFI